MQYNLASGNMISMGNSQTVYFLCKMETGSAVSANIESESPKCRRTQTRKSQNFNFLACITVGKCQRVGVYNKIRVVLKRGAAVVHCSYISISIYVTPTLTNAVRHLLNGMQNIT